MNNILVPIDFSDCSLSALQTALRMAKVTEANVHAFVNLPPNIDNFLFYETGEEKIDEDKLDHWVGIKRKELEEIAESIDCKHLESFSCTQGDLVEETNQLVKKLNVDLIIMGTSGASGVKQYTIGSNTQKVMRNVKCPILIVKESIKELKPKKIVFLSTFNTVDKPAYEWTMDLACYFNSHVHLLNVDTPKYFTEIPELVKLSMKEFREIKPFVSTSMHQTKALNPEFGLKKFLTEQEADVVVVTTKGIKGLASMFYFSVAEGIANHLEIPVVSFKV